jgi:hypothetical protein
MGESQRWSSRRSWCCRRRGSLRDCLQSSGCHKPTPHQARHREVNHCLTALEPSFICGAPPPPGPARWPRARSPWGASGASVEGGPLSVVGRALGARRRPGRDPAAWRVTSPRRGPIQHARATRPPPHAQRLAPPWLSLRAMATQDERGRPQPPGSEGLAPRPPRHAGNCSGQSAS